MHVAVFYQHYHTPDCATAARPYALVNALRQRHRVTLITTNAWEARRLTYDVDWIPPGVEAHLLPIPYDNAMDTGQRLRAFGAYAVRALGTAYRAPRPDIVFGSSTPLTVGIVAALAARRWKVPWVFEVRDLWPDFPIQMGALRHPLLQRTLRQLERMLYRNAAHIVTASPDQAAHVRARVGVPAKVTPIEYGTERDVIEHLRADEVRALRRTLSLPADRALVLYAGAFGRANAMPSLVQTARRLTSWDDVCFVFVGDGYHAPLLRQAARQHAHIVLLPPQPRRRALMLFRMADLSLVSFADRPVLATNGPSKLYDSLAAGTPVIVTNPGWTKTLVETHRCGWYVPAEQPDALAARIRRCLNDPAALSAAGERGAALARERFDRAAHLRRLVTLIQNTADASC